MNNVIKVNFKQKQTNYKTPWGLGDIVVLICILSLVFGAYMGLH